MSLFDEYHGEFEPLRCCVCRTVIGNAADPFQDPSCPECDRRGRQEEEEEEELTLETARCESCKELLTVVGFELAERIYETKVYRWDGEGWPETNVEQSTSEGPMYTCATCWGDLGAEVCTLLREEGF